MSPDTITKGETYNNLLIQLDTINVWLEKFWCVKSSYSWELSDLPKENKPNVELWFKIRSKVRDLEAIEEAVQDFTGGTPKGFICWGWPWEGFSIRLICLAAPSPGDLYRDLNDNQSSQSA
ncbi:hypothetical protein WISP_41881 [Willisornis vidua]|uniref:Uncharacterized protein n=1 Tax=Willisornis vidua TaxID=1566151 RepID=A0ABQ9DGJ7_9PASS|nr:hypothetical protein WISP_41881 [Willisornis vidua]